MWFRHDKENIGPETQTIQKTKLKNNCGVSGSENSIEVNLGLWSLKKEEWQKLLHYYYTYSCLNFEFKQPETGQNHNEETACKQKNTLEVQHVSKEGCRIVSQSFPGTL